MTTCFSRLLRTLTFSLLLLSPTVAAAWTNGQNAKYVMGQSNFSNHLATAGDTGMYNPHDVAIDETHNKLYVVDNEHHRVMRFSLPITSNNPAAELVFGQPTFTEYTFGLSRNTFENPTALAVDTDGRLWVLDQYNHRVVWFNNAYAVNSNQPDADGVLCQPDFTSKTSSANGMYYPRGLVIDTTGTLYIADTMHNRVLRFGNAASKSGSTSDKANGVLGQSDLSSTSAALSRSGMSSPRGLALEDGSLFVADRSNARVLRFDNVASKANGAEADGVLGQNSYTTNTANLTRWGMEAPSRVLFDAFGRLYVSDGYRYDRILIFSATNARIDGADAEAVLGATDFTTTNSGCSNSRLSMDSSGAGMAFQASQRMLFVADTDNNRVMVFKEPGGWLSVEYQGTTYSTGDTVSLGTALGQADYDFVLENIGDATLTFESPAMSLSGTDSADFSIVTQPPATLAAGESATVTIRFGSRVLGSKTATLSIKSDDPAQNPFTLVLTATPKVPAVGAWWLAAFAAGLLGVGLLRLRRAQTGQPRTPRT